MMGCIIWAFSRGQVAKLCQRVGVFEKSVEWCLVKGRVQFIHRASLGDNHSSLVSHPASLVIVNHRASLGCVSANNLDRERREMDVFTALIVGGGG